MIFDVDELSFPAHWTPQLIRMIEEQIEIFNTYQENQTTWGFSGKDSLPFKERKPVTSVSDPCSAYEGRRKYKIF